MTSNVELYSKFNSFFETVVKRLSNCEDHDKNISFSFERIKDIVEYNVPHGKRTRGLTLVSAFQSLKKEAPTDEETNIALALGWAVEILQASFLIADDIMDQSETRRGRLCWYKVPGVGLQAVNDSVILESCVFLVLRHWCRHLPCYVNLFDLFHQVLINTQMGQSLDMETSERPEVDFTVFTRERYAAIIKYKTAFYSFYLPVAVALHLAEINDEGIHSKVCELLAKIGELFQIQDDVLDCYGDPSVTGKIGTDIEDNKCTWLIIKALEKANPEQIQALQANYGKKESDKVKVVKQIFNDLNLLSVFETYESDQYQVISSQIKQFDQHDIPTSIFFNLLDKIYKRKK